MERVVELWNESEVNKYMEKYRIMSFDIGYSLSLRKFILLICNLQSDKSEKLDIEFSIDRNKNFGRSYIRYTLILQSQYFNQELFIQIPYDKENFLNGSLFTLFNIHAEVNGVDNDTHRKQKKIIEECYFDFVTNYK